MQGIDELLPAIIKRLGLKTRFNAEAIIHHWDKIVGPELAEHTRPGKVHNRVLVVKANNAVWAHHLSMLQMDIISKINSYFGEQVVREIRFQAGYFKKDQNENTSGDSGPPVPNWRQGMLGERDREKIGLLTETIENAKLKDKIRLLLHKEYSLRQAKQNLNWHSCGKCGVLCPPDDDLCAVCRIEIHAEHTDEVRKILRQAPWLSYDQCRNYVDCRQADYAAVKKDLIDKILKDSGRGDDNQVDLMTLTMLLTGVEPQALTEELMAKTLAMFRRKDNVSASGR